MKKKKKNKKGGNQETIAMDTTSIDKFSSHPHKVKFPCIICKGDHLLRDFPGIPKVLEVWYLGSHWPLEIMLVKYPQIVIVRFMGKRINSDFPVIYVKQIILFTFFLVWMKPQNFWTTLQLLNLVFQLVIKIFPWILH